VAGCTSFGDGVGHRGGIVWDREVGERAPDHGVGRAAQEGLDRRTGEVDLAIGIDEDHDVVRGAEQRVDATSRCPHALVS
jgi:hypothetical protein